MAEASEASADSQSLDDCPFLCLLRREVDFSWEDWSPVSEFRKGTGFGDRHFVCVACFIFLIKVKTD